MGRIAATPWGATRIFREGDRTDEDRRSRGRAQRGPTVSAGQIAATPRGATRIFRGQPNARSGRKSSSLDGAGTKSGTRRRGAETEAPRHRRRGVAARRSPPRRRRENRTRPAAPSTVVSAATNALAAAARSSSKLSSRNSFTGGHDAAPQFSAKWIRGSKGRASVVANVVQRTSSGAHARASPAGPLRKSACSTSSSDSVKLATSYAPPVAPEKNAVRAAGASAGFPSTTVAWSTKAL